MKDVKDTVLPTDPTERKGIPVASGVLDYFPAALAEIARVSKFGNDQHNPGEPLHWARGKSMDHSDTIIRHFMERGTRDKDGQRHTAKAAWRMLALLQEELEREEGAPLPRGARVVVTKTEPEKVPVFEDVTLSGKGTFASAVQAGWTPRRKWVVRTPDFATDCIAAPGTCLVCWRDAEPGEVIDPKTAVRVYA